MVATANTTEIFLSRRGRKDFKKSINKLENERHRIIIGLSERDKINNREGRLEEIERLARLDTVESEIAEKRQVLRTAKQFPSKKASTRLVTLGSKVELISAGGDHFIYTIVDLRPFDTFYWPGIRRRHTMLLRIS